MWVAAYMAAIVLVNWLFTLLPLVETPVGEWPPASLIVGLILVVRDWPNARSATTWSSRCWRRE
jgi:hypothetical protein